MKRTLIIILMTIFMMTLKAENKLIAFRVINVYSLYNHIPNNPVYKKYEVVSNSVSRDLDNDFFQNLSFYSSKTQDEIEFEVFSTFATVTYRESRDIFRMSKDYKNAKAIQTYFFNKYGIKYFKDIEIEQKPDLIFSDWIFDRNHSITLADFVEVIKPNFLHSFIKIIELDESLFNWDFFMCYEKFNSENPLLKYYIYSDIDYNSLKSKSEDIAKNFFKLISDNNSYTDVRLNGLLIDTKFKSDELIIKYFTAKIITGNDTIIYLEPKFVEGIDNFMKTSSISENELFNDAIKINDKLNVLKIDL